MVKLRRKKVNENFNNMYSIQPGETGGYNPYTYSLISLDNFCEQKGNPTSMDSYINTGSYVKGQGFYDDNYYSGVIRNIIKKEDGSISHIIILDDKTAKFIKLRIDKIRLLK